MGGLLSTTSSWALCFGLWFVFGYVWRLLSGCAGCSKLLFPMEETRRLKKQIGNFWSLLVVFCYWFAG